MISIITTVKNGSKYILETLESIKNQTYQEFEHIVVDDGSTDNTIQLLEDFQERNPNYKLFVFQPGNLGRGKALNFAVSKEIGRASCRERVEYTEDGGGMR